MSKRITISVPGPSGGQVNDPVLDRTEVVGYFMYDPYIRRLLEQGEWEIEIRPKKEDDADDR